MRKQIKKKIYKDTKESYIPIIEKKITLVTPIYPHRKINISNLQEKNSPKNINIITKDNKLNKNANQLTQNTNMNSIEININNKERKNLKKQNINYSNIGFITETLSRILNTKKDNKHSENIFIGNRKIEHNKTIDSNENKENIRNNYNDKTNTNINLNNQNINRFDNNLNDMMFHSNNLHSYIQRNNYIKRKIINFCQNKMDFDDVINVNNLNNIRKLKEVDSTKNNSQNITKKMSNIINNDDNNNLNKRNIYDYTNNNNNKNINNNFNNSIIENVSSLQKRRVSIYDFNKTPNGINKHIINYRKNEKSGNRVTAANSCCLDNILSFKKLNPQIFYKSPSNRSSKLNMQTGRISRDYSESRHGCNYKKKSAIFKKNLLKYPSSRDTTFKKLNIKNKMNLNKKNSFFSLNYTNADSYYDNTSIDSGNKRILDKKHTINGQKTNYHLKIKKDNITKNTKTIKEYINKDNNNYIIKAEKRNINKILYGKMKYNKKDNEINKYKKITHQTISHFKNMEKDSNLPEFNDEFVRVINDKEYSIILKKKKLSKSSSFLHCKNIFNNDTKNIFKKIKNNESLKKNQNKRCIHVSNILSNNIIQGENQNEKILNSDASKNDKNTKSISNDFSSSTTIYKYNSGNLTKSSTHSSFLNEEAININKNMTNDNNIKITIYEEEKIFDFYILYTLESKLKILLMKINKYQVCYNECQDFLSYFFGINFYEKELTLFSSEQNKNQMTYYIKFELLCYLMCYDISFNKNYNQASILLKTIFTLLHKNYLMLISYIIKKIYENNNDNKEKQNNLINNNYNEQMIIIKKLQEVIKNELKMNIDIQDVNEVVILQTFSDNYKQIKNYYEMIITNIYSHLDEINNINNIFLDNMKKKTNCYNFPDCLKINMTKLNDKKKCYIILEFFINSLKTIDSYNMKDINLFFNLYLNKSTDNLFIQQYYNYKRNNSLIPPSKSLNLEKVILPPINNEKYNYTLILDLDETLIYLEKEYYTFNNVHNIKNKKLTLRPGLFNFLDRMKKIYEIILFTFSPTEYASPIIELIEKDEKYFEHKLYIQQASYNNGDYVKSLSCLGRNIKNTIIIEDNINNVNKLYRDNTICIKPFYGDISNEKNTLQLLGNILNKIRYDAEITGDIRKSISKENYNIITEISSNLEE